jgi:hypothetical protein
MKREIFRLFMGGGMWRWAEKLEGALWDREETEAAQRGETARAKEIEAGREYLRRYVMPPERDQGIERERSRERQR